LAITSAKEGEGGLNILSFEGIKEGIMGKTLSVLVVQKMPEIKLAFTTNGRSFGELGVVSEH
jgi:hypothetical protein